ncbi:MAG TPA: hypothetical protein VGG64_27945 [Pirellulales bacterium]|jgi:hypothetical protein
MQAWAIAMKLNRHKKVALHAQRQRIEARRGRRAKRDADKLVTLDGDLDSPEGRQLYRQMLRDTKEQKTTSVPAR